MKIINALDHWWRLEVKSRGQRKVILELIKERQKEMEGSFDWQKSVDNRMLNKILAIVEG